MLQVNTEIDGGERLWEIFESGRFEVEFQDMVSLTNREVIGLEGFIRAYDLKGDYIDPVTLFSLASSGDQLIDLERCCRRKVLEEFSALAKNNDRLALSLNFETSLVDKGVVGSGQILEAARDMGLDPAKVIVEVVESRANNVKALLDFARLQRENGFMLALSDTGSKLSSIDKISLVKPDLVKISMDLIRGVDQDSAKQEVLRALVSMSHRVGAMVCAMGVEHDEEAITAMDLGVDLLQGFLVRRPRAVKREAEVETPESVNRLALSFRDHRGRKSQLMGARMRKYAKIADRILPELEKSSRYEIDETLDKIVSENRWIECVYILDKMGVQISETVFDAKRFGKRRKLIYKPARRGTNMSLKEYYLAIKSGQPRYLSKPYISLASGNPCVTLSMPFEDAKGIGCIACIDFDAESTLDFEKSYMKGN